MTSTLPTIYDLNEAATKLHVTRRFLVRWLRKHPADDKGQPFVSAKAGRKRLFTEAAILRIFAAMAPEPVPTLASLQRTRGIRPGVSAGRSHESVMAEALALCEKKPRRSLSDEPRGSDVVVPMRGRKRRLSPPQ